MIFFFPAGVGAAGYANSVAAAAGRAILLATSVCIPLVCSFISIHHVASPGNLVRAQLFSKDFPLTHHELIHVLGVRR